MSYVMCSILNRQDLKIRDHFQCFDWTINNDYVSASQSEFYTLEDVNINPAVGDYILVKKRSSDNLLTGTGFLFFGVIQSYSDGVVIANLLTELLNFEIVTASITGADVISHMYNLILTYLVNDPTKTIGNLGVVLDSEKIAFSYQPSDPPSTVNLREYFQNCFKKYGVIWEITSLDLQPNGQYKIITKIHRPKYSLQIKDNVSAFINWEVYVNPTKASGENMIQIIDKATTNMMNPTILSTWYIQDDGEVTQDPTNVTKPTRNTVYIYDTEQEDPPTYESVARSELSANLYSHEIEFDFRPDNILLTEDQIRIGTICDVRAKKGQYESIISGFSKSSANDIVHVQLGNLRSTLQSLQERSK